MTGRARRLPAAPALAALAALLAASAALSLCLGAVPLRLGEVIGPLSGSGDPAARSIILGLRLPRTLLALAAGFALSASGAVFQALLRNPLADPYLLGVSSGAALGAVLCMALGAAGHAGAVTLSALAGGAGAAAAVYLIARRAEGLPPQTLILAGVIINSFCSALALLLNVMMEARQLQGAVFWLMGSLASPPPRLWAIFAGVAAGGALALAGGSKMNLLAQGEEAAASLGVEVEREKRILFLAACLMTGTVVAACGLIGFVGLVVPHAARMLFGPDHRVLLPASALLGASFLILSDVAARAALAPAELPVGVVTALIGAPFFLFLMRRRANDWSNG